MFSRFIARVRAGSVLVATTLAVVASAGCADAPHFDHAQYQVSTPSPVLHDYASSTFLARPENYLFKVLDYLPQFCAATSTTSVLNSGRTIALDWHDCRVGGRTVVGELESVSGGAYEGLVEVTATLNGVVTTFETWMRLAPVEVVE